MLIQIYLHRNHYVCIGVYVYIYIYVCVCVCVYIHYVIVINMLVVNAISNIYDIIGIHLIRLFLFIADKCNGWNNGLDFAVGHNVYNIS